MLLKLKSHLARRLAILAATIAVTCTLATLAAAQEQPPPKWELFGGYSVFDPGATIHGELPGALVPLSSRLEWNPRGAGASVTYDFNRWFGLTLDTSTHWGSGETTLAKRIDDAAFSNLSFGPKITFRHERFSPFLEVLVGDHRLMPDAFHDVDKLGLMLGGGIDVNVSRHIALRLIRADFVMSNYRYGAPVVTPSTDIRGLRAQTGVVFMFGGGAPPLPPTAACTIQPSEVFAGETVTATAAGSNFAPKRTVTYNWNGTGVKVTGSDSTSQIDTAGLQPGAYVVTANLNDGRKNGSASCSARFTVKEPRPPVISCSADPSSVPMGGTSTITSNASSPDGRRLIYSYNASSGSIAGTGATAALSTQGAQPGRINVTCNVNDDRTPPLTASATTTVDVQAPPPPPPAPAPEIKQLEAKLALHSIYFQTARPTEEHPEGGLLDSQADILKALAEDYKNYLKYMPDAHLILSGHADPRGTAEYNKRLTERRVERTKAFLVEHGVPADHFELKAFGEEDQLTADQIKQQMADNPDLSAEERQKMMSNLKVLVLANNRRVDVTLSTTGQQSVRRYPFNARDFLALISIKGGEKKPIAKAKKKP
jgi:outer membrane protein OmpA-like peptidoglycan-associated protein/opacity protein-like surface antigen